VTKTSCLEALELFRVNPEYFDLVITDYVMPHMTGVDLAKQMMHLRPDIPVILCTGWTEKVAKEKTRKTGLRAFLLKPLKLRDVAAIIRDVLDEK
jgi:CheY-like chemotaxis protein